MRWIVVRIMVLTIDAVVESQFRAFCNALDRGLM